LDDVEPVPAETWPEVSHKKNREANTAWWEALPWSPQGDLALLVVRRKECVRGWAMGNMEFLCEVVWRDDQDSEEAHLELGHRWW